MKNLFIVLIVILSPFTHVIAQDYVERSEHGDWKYMYGESHFYLWNSNGTGIENFNKIPDFAIRIQKNEGGTINVRLGSALVYSYDDSKDEKNYVAVDLIIDDGDIVSFKGTINEVEEADYTRIYLSSLKDGIKFKDLFEEMRTGKDIYVRTTGSGDPKVFQYSLIGFNEGLDKLVDSWSSWKESNKNPFNTKKIPNPFNK